MAVTRTQFAYQLLAGLNVEATADNVHALVSWMTLENTNAPNNPLATEKVLGSPGEIQFNPQGVRGYADLCIGVAATVLTLKNGLYGEILTALDGGTFDQIASAIDASPWGDTNVSQVSPDYAANIASGDSSVFPTEPPAATVAPDVPSTTEVPPAEVAPAQPVASEPRTYTVKAGDTLTSIAAQFGVSEQALFDANAEYLDNYAKALKFTSSNNGNLIWPGEVVTIP